MYIWVLLATFMVTIYSFNLSYRADMKEILLEPQIEPIISRMMVLHGAAERYMEDKGPTPDPNHPDPNHRDRDITYFPGEIPFSEINDEGYEVGLKAFLPYGFNDDADDEISHTMIYCLNKQGTAVAPGCNNTTQSCCNDPQTIPFLVTYRCVPSKWLNRNTGGASLAFRKVLNRIGGTAYDMGYVEELTNEEYSNPDKNMFGSDIGIRQTGGGFVSIPKYILTRKPAGSKNSFAEACGNPDMNDIDDEEELARKKCSVCIAYVSAKKFIK